MTRIVFLRERPPRENPVVALLCLAFGLAGVVAMLVLAAVAMGSL